MNYSEVTNPGQLLNFYRIEYDQCFFKAKQIAEEIKMTQRMQPVANENNYVLVANLNLRIAKLQNEAVELIMRQKSMRSSFVQLAQKIASNKGNLEIMQISHEMNIENLIRERYIF